MFSKSEIKIMRPFYLHRFILSLSKVIIPFYVLYFLSIGLNLRQIGLIATIRSVVSLIFEIPTGTIADVFGKKTSVIIGYILSGITLILVPFFDSFLSIAILFAINALTETLFSGAESARQTDIIEQKKTFLMDTFFYNKRSISNLGFIVSGILGSLIVKFRGMGNLWIVFGIGTILGTIFLLFQQDDKKSYEVEGEDWLKKDFLIHIKTTFQYIIKHKTLILLFIGISLFYFVDEFTGLIWAPYLQELGFDISNLGFIYTVIGIGGVVIPLIIKKFSQNKPTKIIFFNSLFFAILLLIAGYVNTTLLIILIFILYNFIDDIILPIEEMITNNIIEPKRRATVLSMKSMVESIVGIIAGPIAGVLLGYITFSQGLIMAGVLIFIMGIVYKLTKK